MLVLSFFVVLSMHLLFMFWGTDRFYLSPSKLLAFLSFISVIPYGFVQAFWPESYALPGFGEADTVRFFLAYAVGLLALMTGITLCVRNIGGGSVQLEVAHVKYPALIIFVFCLVSIFLACAYVKFSTAGGFIFYLNNIDNRSQLASASGYFDIVLQASAFLSIFVIFFCRGIHGRPGLPSIALLILLLVVVSALFGGRKTPIYLIIFSFCAHCIYIRPLKLFSGAALAAGVTLLFLFVAVRVWRGSAELDDLSVLSAAADIAKNLSYNDTYIYIMAYFSDHDYWYGRQFLDLLVRLDFFGATSIRPPLDEGVYIRSLVEGYPVSPPEDFSKLYKSSLPPETFGNGFASFGYAGVLALFLLKGIVIGLVYRLVVARKFNPIYYFLFLFFIFNFHISNLRIVQVTFIVATVFLLASLLRALNKIGVSLR